MPTDLARLYSEVFAPEYFVLVCTLALLLYERRTDPDRGRTRLAAQILVVAVAWGAAFGVYQSAPLLFDPVPSWGEDFTGSVGLGVGFVVIGAAWRVHDWGRLVPEFALLLLGLTVVHTAVTPFWDVSSHVAYAVAPAGYLVAVDRRFGPLLAVAAGMVFARPLAGAHTWLQSVAGFVLAAALVAWVAIRTTGEGRSESRPSVVDRESG